MNKYKKILIETILLFIVFVVAVFGLMFTFYFENSLSVAKNIMWQIVWILTMLYCLFRIFYLNGKLEQEDELYEEPKEEEEE